MAGDITQVAIIGAGYMGSGILQVLARAGVRCVVADTDAERARVLHAECITQAQRFEDIGYFPAGATAAIQINSAPSESVAAAVGDADLVIEAVYENAELKKSVLSLIESAAPHDAIMASNTSAIPIAELASALRHPSRMYGVHWFNPAQFLPCVEVIESPGACPEVTQRLLRLLRRVGRSPVVVADSPGFVANRLQFALFKEAALMVAEGLATPAQIDDVVRASFGFRLPFFGPFAIADMAGLDVYTAAFDVLEQAFGERFRCPSGLRALVRSGRLGTKSGGGYYEMTATERQELTASRDRAYVAMARTLAALSISEPPRPEPIEP